MNRRDFTLKTLPGFFALLDAQWTSGAQTVMKPDAHATLRRIIFRSQTGKLGIINEDGSGLRYLDFDIPGQVNWGYGPFFSDGRRIIVTSFEEGRGWEGKAVSHIWIYNLVKKTLSEIATKNRPADYHVPCLLMPDEQRIVTNPFIGDEQRVYIMNLDGSDQVEVTKKGEGFTYGVSLSPDGLRFAFHVTNIMPYSIFTIGIDGSNRTLVATHPDHLYFGTSWSVDGEWILYQDCQFKTDPGHDWSDLCIGRADGSEHRVITEGHRQWFAASYGSPDTRGSGSNIPQWSPDGLVVTYTRAKPDSRTAWQWATDRPDNDHFNRNYRPGEARGGTDICLLNPFTRAITQITDNEPLVWDFRTVWAPEGDRIAFCRAKVGYPSELWVMDADGQNQLFLTRGEEDKGVDHPRFLLTGV